MILELRVTIGCTRKLVGWGRVAEYACIGGRKTQVLAYFGGAAIREVHVMRIQPVLGEKRYGQSKL